MSGPVGSTRPGAFGERLRRLREAAALSQEELAARAGLTAKAISALERGERRRPYPHTVRALADALGLDEQTRAALVGSARSPAPATPVRPPRPAWTPAATPLLGRDIELNELVTRLRDPGLRLLTVTGPGGVGKTRLAAAAAAAVAGNFPGGVAVAELAAIRDVSLVLPTVARTLGLTQLAAADVLDAVAAHLIGARSLLLLDNVEHLLDAAPDLGALLQRCPELVVLATSRAPLRLAPEQEFPLGPLATPDGTTPADVAASPAAQVFLDRARAVSPTLRLDTNSAPIVAAICRRLDGLPLALELAAAHARLLPPATLLDRLSSSVDLGRSRDRPERQRTMAATLDWSHALLTRGEQRLLRRLSVFAGSFSLAAVEQVAAADEAVLEPLAGLVEQSLVLPDSGLEARYRMLEPIREYAAVRLQDAGEADAYRDRHARYFRQLASEARSGLRDRAQPSWLDRLDQDQSNLRAALGRLREQGELSALARFGADVWLFWALRGYAGEGVELMADVVAAGADAELSLEDRAAASLALAALRNATGDVSGTSEAAAAAVELAREARAERLLTDALQVQGAAAVFAGDLDGASDLLAEAVQRAVESGDEFLLAHARCAQGQLAVRAGEPAAAQAALDDAEAIARRGALPFTLAVVLNMQSVVALVSGADESALQQLIQAAELAVEVGSPWTLVYTMPALGMLAARRERYELAATLFAAGIATAEASSVAVSYPPSREGAEHWQETVRRALDHETWQRATLAGRTLSPSAVPALAEQLRRPAPA